MKRRDFIKSGLGLAAAGWATPASAQLVRKYAEELNNGEYNWFPERSLSGPMLIIVSIPDQKVHVYRNGIRVAASSCSTGKPGHRTPTGVFKILEKDKHHRSSTYSNAPMPNMNRLTWSGIALHAGQLPGYPASHGCVRLPMGFSELLFGITRKGVTVVIADNESQPASVTHPSLVLGDYARSKFGAVAKKIADSTHPVDPEQTLTHTSVVISHKDSKAVLLEDHEVVAESRIKLANKRKQLGDRVYNLTGVNQATRQLKWQQATFDKGSLSANDGDVLGDIRPDPQFEAELQSRAHRGLTIVTTNGHHKAANRTGPGFVIFDGFY